MDEFPFVRRTMAQANGRLFAVGTNKEIIMIMFYSALDVEVFCVKYG